MSRTSPVGDWTNSVPYSSLASSLRMKLKSAVGSSLWGASEADAAIRLVAAASRVAVDRSTPALGL